MLEIKALPIHTPGNLAFHDVDREILQRTPPTEESITRAKEIGLWLGQLLAANRRGVGESNAAFHLFNEAGLEVPYSVKQELWEASSDSYRAALDQEQELIRSDNAYLRNQREVTA